MLADIYIYIYRVYINYRQKIEHWIEGRKLNKKQFGKFS